MNEWTLELCDAESLALLLLVFLQQYEKCIHLVLGIGCVQYTSRLFARVDHHSYYCACQAERKQKYWCPLTQPYSNNFTKTLLDQVRQTASNMISLSLDVSATQANICSQSLQPSNGRSKNLINTLCCSIHCLYLQIH